MKLIISYKNGTSDEFSENQIDCSRLTIRGHASELVECLQGKTRGMRGLDKYNAVLLDDIISVRVLD